MTARARRKRTARAATRSPDPLATTTGRTRTRRPAVSSPATLPANRELQALADRIAKPRRLEQSSLVDIAAQLRTPAEERTGSSELDDIARDLGKPRKRATSRSLSEVAAQIRAPKHEVTDAQPLDVALPARPVSVELISGRAHYERVIAAVMGAQTSVWIATANVKGMMVEAAPGRKRRRRGRDEYVSVLEGLDELAAKGVELRLLHAELPSRPFREEIAKHPRLLAGALELARCPRVHLKAVIVDGSLLYLGSANWTGAGLGAKGSGKRNFELGIVTDDAPLLDQVQAMFDRIWTGGECGRCKLRDVCPGPRDE